MGFVEGYNTFASRRLTMDRPSPNSAGFQSSYRFRDGTPFVSFYGRVKDLFYSATVGTGRDDTIGADKKDFIFRAAYDIPFGLSLGAFTLLGERELAATTTAPLRTQDYTRSGVDLQYDGKNFTANAVWFRAKEDLATTLVSQENDAWYLQAFYVTPTRIPVVPVLRFESVQSSNGQASTQAVNAAVMAYVRSNINVSFDYIRQTKVPPGASKTHRYSVLAIFAF
jgi:transglutaminase-like putative cysteine protease